MKTIYRAAAALAAFIAVAPAFAQQGQDQGQRQHMTPEQREQRMAERFNAADTNHDGKLSLDEAKAGLPMVARNFDQIDTEHTGSVTLEQLRAYAKTHMGQGRRGGNGAGNGGANSNGG
jgi:Ca2+-binding EF-hand superfamily protein